jgi:hypothetical protein
MSNRYKLLTVSLIAAVLVLAISASLIGYQMNQAQNKNLQLQEQINYYKNMSDSLQIQEGNLRSEISNLQKPIDNITMSHISVGQWYPDSLVGYPYYKFLNVTVLNAGYGNVGGLILDVQLRGNNTNINTLGIYVANRVGVIHTQESKSMSVQLISPTIQSTDALREYDLTLTLLLDGKVLDRQTMEMGL